MKIVLGIPSGNRVKKLLKCIEKWRKVCDFPIAIATWDSETVGGLSSVDTNEGAFYATNGMNSFATFHNILAKLILDWDVYICGADDLYPDNGISKIEKVCEQNPGKVIWVRDGLFNALPTHPIITREWYDKHGQIFDEDYRHNFTDTDLYIRCLKAGELIKCFDISFDHRHPLKTCEPMDEIYQIGSETFQDDRKIFYEKHPNANEIIQEYKCEEVVVSN